MKVKLTSQQYKLANWAIDGMYDRVEADPAEDVCYTLRNIPDLYRGWLLLKDDFSPTDVNQMAIDDFLYRIEIQILNMIDDEPDIQHRRGHEQRIAANLAKKVRKTWEEPHE